MDESKVKVLSQVFSSSKEKIFIVNQYMSILWSNIKDAPYRLRKMDFYEAKTDQKDVFWGRKNGKKYAVKFPVTEEKMLIYENDEHFCSVNVLPVFSDDEDKNLEGYVITMNDFFGELEKYIYSPFVSTLKKFLITLRNSATEIAFNADIIGKRMEDLEEYDLMDRSAHINQTLNNTLASCINFEEMFAYGANDFNIILSNASEFINDLLSAIKRSANNQGMSFNYLVEKDIYLKTDYSRYTVAIMNIISNSIKYNKNTTKQLFVEFKKEGGYAALVVSDNGIGIDNEKAKNIFEPFSNANKLDLREALGLPLVKQFADKFEGSVAFRKREFGTDFSLRLPYEIEVDKDEVNAPNTDYFQGAYSPIDMYILKAVMKDGSNK